MKRGTLALWLGVTLAGSFAIARADGGDRDREAGRMRFQEVQRSLSAREAQVVRPDASIAITGRGLGGDTVERGNPAREFKSAADMGRHMTQQVKIRRTEGPAPSDLGTASGATARAGQAARELRDAQQRLDDELLLRHTQLVAEPGDQKTPQEARVEDQSVTGHALGRDHFQAGQQYADPINRERADQLRHAYPNAGRATSDPSRLDDAMRAHLAEAGFSRAQKKQVSTDIEDKTR